MRRLRCTCVQYLLLLLPASLILVAAGCGSQASQHSSNPGGPSKTITSIAVSPARTTLAVGATRDFTAIATYSDGSTADVTSSATWVSSAKSIAKLTAGIATAESAGSATVTATLDGVSGSASLTVSPSAPTLVSIAITPAAPTVPIGASEQFTATAKYSDGTTGDVTSGATWTSSAPSVATISAAGLATAASAGATTITASLNGVSATAAMTVPATTPTLTGIAISPATAKLTAGATQQFTATAAYSDGSTSTVTGSAAWASSNPAVATISAAGLASALAAGNATITASYHGFTATATLTVAAKSVTSLAVSPATATIAAGTTQAFTATATYNDGSTANVTSTAHWVSANASVATINSSGVATGVATGSSSITASIGGASGTAAITVTAQTPASIAITPSAPSFSEGTTQQFTATATYKDGSTANITSSVSWASSNSSVVTINTAGLATALSSGSATITATQSGVTGSTILTVTSRTPSSIAITPNPASFDAGSTQQFSARATYPDGSTADVTSSAAWSVANTSVATIDKSGLATGVASGSTTVTATVDGVSANAPVTVTTPSASGVSITTWHVDNNRSGLNSKEQTLTPSSVNPSSFGKLFSYQTDGYVYGTPLLMSGVTINGAKHNVLFVATEHDSVYAFDSDSYGTGAPLWQVSLLQSGETPLTNGPIQPYEGVTSTPVIDPQTGTLYVVSAQKGASGGFFRLHALDITTGAEKFGGPVTLSASVPGTGEGGATESLDTSCIQRAALLLANGNVYMGFGGCHTGWLLAYNATTLQQVGKFNASPNLNGEGPYASAGGVWMGGGGPVADSSGNVYIVTGNGPWNGTDAFADTVVKFGPTPKSGPNGTMQPIDYFTPADYQYMDCADSDLASGGLMLIPGSNDLITGGKTGKLFLVNSANMGHEQANDAGALQVQVWGAGLTNGGSYTSSPCTDPAGTHTAQITSYEIFGTSAYYNNYLYLGVTPTSSTSPGGVRQFEFSGTLTPFDQTGAAQAQGTRGTSPFISSNGTSDGIVWMIDQGNPIQGTYSSTPSHATLYAYSADSFPNELYDSNQNSSDAPGYGIKFSSPVVANGKVYISTGHDLPSAANPHGEIDVYGLK